MSFQDVAILLLGVGLVATWVLGARMIRRTATELDEYARDRVEHDELQTSVGRTLGQLQVAADNLADALATQTERLHELLAQADAQSAMLGEAIAVAAALTERLRADAVSLQQAIASARAPERNDLRHDDAGASFGVRVGYVNGSANGAGGGGLPIREDASRAIAVSPGPAAPEAPAAVVPLDQAGADVDMVAAPASADEVRRLARDGMDLATIARRTNRGREEVRLLLRFAGSPGGTDGRRGLNGMPGQATLTPGTFRRP